ncbi:MAG TPA: Phenylacetic acid catabolic protein [Chloroflexota bacterium]|nr:Phenylacetic acid catabolic protein [Chloroflexota bacterium]
MALEADAAPAALIRLVAALADNKYFLGRRYAGWCTSAPTLESAVASAAMAQDEIGHARSLYPLLRDLAGDSPQTEPETRTEFDAMPALQEPFSGWEDFVAANFLLDTAVTVMLEAARTSSHQALAQRARRMLEEEPLHWLHAEGWVQRMADGPPGMRRALAGALRRATPSALGWFDHAAPDLVASSMLDAGAQDLRMRFRGRVNPPLADSGLEPV